MNSSALESRELGLEIATLHKSAYNFGWNGRKFTMGCGSRQWW